VALPITPALDRLYRTKVSQVNTALAQRSTFVAVMSGSFTQCNNCHWDSAHKCSTGTWNRTGPQPFDQGACPVCGGKGRLQTQQQVRIANANVRWSNAGKQDDARLPQGKLPEGHAKIKVPSTKRSTVEQAEYFLVDGVRCHLVGQPWNRGLLSYVITEFVVKRDD